MDSLDPDIRQVLRQQLERGEAELLQAEAQGRVGAATVQLDQTRVGRLSRVDALQQQALAKAALVRAGEQLRRVQAALQRIDSDAYGRCIDCREWIPLARLQADPCVLLCRECQDFRDEDAAAAARREQLRGRRG